MYRFLSLLVLSVLCGCSSLHGPPDLPTAKARVAQYMEEGDYEADVRRSLRPAWRVLEKACRHADRDPQPALVFDIDETALSNYAYNKGLNFGHYGPAFYEWLDRGEAVANGPVLELYQRARRCGVAVFFVTGRRERFREVTAANLRRVGYDEWEGLFLKPDDYARRSAAFYKAESRAEIESRGYDIILNIGDQKSDLEGGYADRTIRLPNPMYRVD